MNQGWKPFKSFEIPYKIFCEIILDGVLLEEYLEGVCWDYNPRRLAGSQWHLNDSSFQLISDFVSVFVSIYEDTYRYALVSLSV